MFQRASCPAGTATLSQRCDTVENESCADVDFQRCDNVALRHYQDVAATSSQHLALDF